MRITALIHAHEYRRYRKAGEARPSSFCAHACGPGTVILDEADYDPATFIVGDDVELYIRTSFDIPAGALSDKMMHRLNHYNNNRSN